MILPLRFNLNNTPEPPIPNRYDTVVAVEAYNNEDLHLIKWFSDIQMAWIWIKNQTELIQTVDDWDVTGFITCADSMDTNWRNGYGENGYCVVTGDPFEFIAYYKPSLQYEDIRDHEEQY